MGGLHKLLVGLSLMQVQKWGMAGLGLIIIGFWHSGSSEWLELESFRRAIERQNDQFKSSFAENSDSTFELSSFSETLNQSIGSAVYRSLVVHAFRHFQTYFTIRSQGSSFLWLVPINKSKVVPALTSTTPDSTREARVQHHSRYLKGFRILRNKPLLCSHFTHKPQRSGDSTLVADPDITIQRLKAHAFRIARGNKRV